MIVIADAGPLLHLFWVDASACGLIIEAFRAGRVLSETAAAALRDLPGRGRLHVRPQLIELALKSLAASD